MVIIAPAGFEFLSLLVNPLEAPVLAPPVAPSSARQTEAVAATDASHTAADEPSFKRERRRQSAGEAGGGRAGPPAYGGLEGLALLSGETGRAVLELAAAPPSQISPALLRGTSETWMTNDV